MKSFILPCLLLLVWGNCSWAADVAKVLIIVGPSSHAPGTHEVEAGGRVMAHCLENMTNLPGVEAEVVYQWPEVEKLQEAATIVFIGDRFPANRFGDPQRHLAELDGVMRQGCGIVCVHYAVGLFGEDVAPDGDHPLLRWMGGYFANRSCPHHQSIARVYPAATITPAVEHPINRGWKEFTLHDEPYINNYFGPDENRLAPNVISLATSLLPPESPQKETVAWCVERPGNGRGFAIVMPHFYKNWQNEDLRRCILNGIAWTAHLEVPQEGVQTHLPDLDTFEPEAVYAQGDPAQTAREAVR